MRSLDVELGAPPVAALGVVLHGYYQHIFMYYHQATHLDLGVRLQAEPLGNGAAHMSQCPRSFCPSKSYQHSPVLARRLGEDALRAEGLLGRL